MADLSATEKASALKQAHQAELMSKANVVGVGVGFRQKAGRRTDTVALVVMVRRKLPKSALAPQDLLPSEIEGVPVDVQEVGVIEAF
jgi:hypothetical protein